MKKIKRKQFQVRCLKKFYILITFLTLQITIIKIFYSDSSNEKIKMKNDSKVVNNQKSKTPSKEELEKKQAEALKLKNEGNAFVQTQQYVKAVGKYCEAIRLFPNDAVLYANRGLCQLKLNK